MSTNKLTRLSMLLVLGLVLSYLETLIPLNATVPGIKLGLANMVTMFVMYRYEVKDAAVILLLRVLITGFMFSGLSTIIFGITGGIFCMTAMSITKKSSHFSVIGVSVSGAVFHNIGQLFVAYIIMQNQDILLYYLPYLCVAGIISGVLIGYVSAFVIERFPDL